MCTTKQLRFVLALTEKETSHTSKIFKKCAEMPSKSNDNFGIDLKILKTLFSSNRGKEYQYIEMVVDKDGSYPIIEACCTNANELVGTRYFIVYPRYAQNLSSHFFVRKWYSTKGYSRDSLSLYFIYSSF